MTTSTNISLACVALACVSILAAPANAADLGNYGGSVKDSYAPAPMAAAGNCYIRGDAGYSLSGDPDVTWPVNNDVITFDANGVVTNYTSTHVTDQVANVSLQNTWLIEGGVGCGSGSRGFRGEIMLGVRGDRDLEGVPGDYTRTEIHAAAPPVVDPHIEDPLHTSLTSYTLMLNGYKDLGNFGGFTPYVGAGIGVAYHIVDDVYFTGNPNLVNQIHGDRDIAFAWSLMAGVGYQLSQNTVLDLGYRYIDLGKATSERSDSAGFVNPRVNIDDIDAHEFKVGLRYHFGQSDCCSYQAMK